MDGVNEPVTTPRTAALEKTLHAWCGDDAQCLDFAEGLERELIAANARIAKLEAALRGLLEDTQHAEHAKDGKCDEDCPVLVAREALK